MKIAFINSNMRPSFVIGSVVYEVQVTGQAAHNMVACFNSGQREWPSPEATAFAKIIEVLVTTDRTIGNRRELEWNDDDRMKIHNRPADLNRSPSLRR